MNEEQQQYPEIEIDKIIIPRPRPHAIFTPEQMEELKASIRTHGFKEPIVLLKKPDGQYELVDGENRIEAMKQLGFKKIPYILADSDEKKAIILSYQKNIIKGFQNPVDGAEAMAKAIEAGATIEDLANWHGHTVQWVKKKLSLNDLPDEFKAALRLGKIPEGVVYEAGKLPDPNEVYNTIKTAIDLGWGVNEVKHFVANRLDELKRMAVSPEETWPKELVSREEMEKMARIRTCGVCGLKYDVDDVWGGLVCYNCLGILAAIRDLEPDPVKALEFVKTVITEYKQRALYEELKKKFESPGGGEKTS